MDRIWLQHYDRGTPYNLTYPVITVDQLLDNAARDHPNRPATNFILRYALGGRLTIGGRMTYKALKTAVDHCAAGLAALGVNQGDRVALMLPNSPQYVIAFFAILRLGAVVVNFNPTYTPPEIKHQLIDSRAETMIILNLFVPRLREVQASLPNLKRVVVTTIYDTLPFPSRQLVRRAQHRAPEWVEVKPDARTSRFTDLLAHPIQPVSADHEPGDVALLQYTGGTTGVPKGAMLTHRNLVANAQQAVAWMVDARPGDERMMCALPFFHVYGMTVGLLCGVVLAAEMVIVPNPRPIENVMRVIHQERATLFPGVPAMYIGIINHPDVGRYDLKSVRACISGAAPLPMEVQHRFEALTGGRLVEGYGLTEASPITHCNPVYGLRKAGAIGIPVSDVEARIVDMETGEDMPFGSGKSGELLVRGPQVMLGYWNRPDETTLVLEPDGWLHTGDIAVMDEDGYFSIVDRKKDMINASGYKIFPREVEEVLYAHPKVREAAVVGIPDPYRGETVKAYVVPKAGVSLTEAELLAYCQQNLAPYKVPKRVEFRQELPQNMAGKVLRRVLVEEEMRSLSAATEPMAVP